MKLYQMPKLSLLLVVCLIAVSGSLGPLFARAEQDLDAPTTIDIGADFEADVIPDEPIAEVDEKDVVVLTEKNFNATVLAAPYALVRYQNLHGRERGTHFCLCVPFLQSLTDSGD